MVKREKGFMTQGNKGIKDLGIKDIMT